MKILRFLAIRRFNHLDLAFIWASVGAYQAGFRWPALALVAVGLVVSVLVERKAGV